MLTLFILIISWCCGCALIRFVIRYKKIKLSLFQVMLFTACKLVAGTVYGYIYKRFYNGDDTWGLNHDGLVQYKRLLRSPAAFVMELFTSNPYPADDSFYFHPYGYLENLEYSIVTKTIAFFNIVSHGNYYINLVFFNFLSFWGMYLLYKLVAEQVVPENRKLVAAVLFLFPPALFWLSGLRAEGFLMLFTGALLYYFNQWLLRPQLKYAVIIILCIVMNGILRNGFMLLLLPALGAWWLSVKWKKPPLQVFAAVYLTIIALVIIGSLWLPPSLNALAVIADRQHDFLTLKGNTRFALAPLDAHPLSFLQVLPQSLLNTFIRPFPWEAKGMLQAFAAAENILVLALAAVTVFFFRRSGAVLPAKNLIWVLVLSGLFNYILTGYTVPFPGAIVRYKIIPEILLISACLLSFPFEVFRKNYRTTASLQM